MRRERVIDALEHRETDFVPYNIELTSEELDKVAAAAGISKEEFFDFAGNHLEKAAYNQKGSYIKPGYFRDEFGVVWNRSGIDKDIGIVDEIILKEPEIGAYIFPEPDEAAVRAATVKLLSNGRDTFKLGKIGMTYFERAWSLRGFENLLTDFLLEEAFVDELFEHILNYNMRIIDIALEYDIDGFYFGDDYGQQSGMLMSPQVWRRFIKPGLASMFQKVKRAGKKVALHSCGNITEILDDLIDIGLDVYQTFQPEIYDMKSIKARYGNSLAFWGGISTQQTLPFVKPHELKEIIRETIGIMAVNGGYIAAPTHQVPADVPAENVLAMIEVLKNQK